MADVRPFPALHYNLEAVGSLGEVTAPPYDVIDAAQREDLLRELAVQCCRGGPAKGR